VVRALDGDLAVARHDIPGPDVTVCDRAHAEVRDVTVSGVASTA